MSPTLSRRQFLTAAPALAATALLPGALLGALAAETPPLPDLSDWDRVRAQFALDPDYAHLASFFIASHPAPVRDAIDAYRRAIDRNPFRVVEQAMFEDDAHNLPLQVQADAVAPGARVLLVDDVLATGGTLMAARALAERLHAQVVGASVLMELGFLGGRKRWNGDAPLRAAWVL